MNTVLNLFFIFLLVAFNAFFAASEIAVISLNPGKIQKMTREGKGQAATLMRFLEHPSRFLATIQVGITLAGFLASASASRSFSGVVAGWLLSAGIPISTTVANGISIVLVVSLLTFLTLVFGELVPKRLALQKYESISMKAARPLRFLSIIASPFISLLTASTNTVVKLLGGNPKETSRKITEEEIMHMVDTGGERGAIRKDERKMIENIFEFDDTTVSRVMTYRTEIVGIPSDSPLDVVLNVISEEGFTRIPVYEGSIDNITGILHAKDLIPVLHENNEKPFQLKNILRPAYFVPESMTADRLFRELKNKKTHIAIVLDEYGGTAGLVTMEDLIEEIMGSIFDEYDVVVEEIRRIDSNTYMLNGQVRLDDLQDYLDIKFPSDSYETLNGFLIAQLGRIPYENENPVIEYEGMVFRIEEVRNRTISKVKACRP